MSVPKLTFEGPRVTWTNSITEKQKSKVLLEFEYKPRTSIKNKWLKPRLVLETRLLFLDVIQNTVVVW